MLNEQRLITQFMELVQIDSESGSERQIVDYLKQLFIDLGYKPIEDNAGTNAEIGAGNIIVNIAGNIKTDKKLLFTAHVDTVTPGKGIIPEVRDGYIYSKGKTILGGDDKAGVSAIIELVRVLKEENVTHGDLQIVLTVGEEIGLLGSKNIDQKLLDANMGIALDSNGDVGRIVLQGPVQVSIDATIEGKSAHAGISPESGISAIEVMADAIVAMPLGRIDQDTTANIGIVQGGLATNIVCETVNIKGEARSIVREKLERQVATMKQALELAANKRNAKVQIVTNEEYPEFNFQVDDLEVQLVSEAVNNIGVTCDYVSSGGGSDANIFNGYGIKTINLGIGMENIHTCDERIAIEQLQQIAKLLIEIVNVVARKTKLNSTNNI
jgi:tripeptide aminopeptidase